MSETLTGQQVADSGLDGWTLLLHYGIHGLDTQIHTESFGVGLRLVAAIGEAAEELDRAADLDLRRTRVAVRLTGDGDGSGAAGVTEADVRLARRISDLAAEAGATLENASLAHLELGLDSPDWREVAPFWAAVLGSEVTSGDDWADVGDRNQVLPLIWFQQSGRDEPRQRWHHDLWIDPAQLKPRIDAALAAGGQLLRDDAEQGCMLADPQGNKVCLCTWHGRA